MDRIKIQLRKTATRKLNMVKKYKKQIKLAQLPSAQSLQVGDGDGSLLLHGLRKGRQHCGQDRKLIEKRQL